jgi:hypothetical protein
MRELLELHPGGFRGYWTVWHGAQRVGVLHEWPGDTWEVMEVQRPGGCAERLAAAVYPSRDWALDALYGAWVDGMGGEP